MRTVFLNVKAHTKINKLNNVLLKHPFLLVGFFF